jgi:hypothetical protein
MPLKSVIGRGSGLEANNGSVAHRMREDGREGNHLHESGSPESKPQNPIQLVM